MAITQEKVTVCSCERCGHQWQPDLALLKLKKQSAPAMCPKCKSLYWNQKEVAAR